MVTAGRALQGSGLARRWLRLRFFPLLKEIAALCFLSIEFRNIRFSFEQFGSLVGRVLTVQCLRLKIFQIA